MKYFENAKTHLDAWYAEMNHSVGFKCADGFTDTIESKNSYVARVSAAYDRHVEFIRIWHLADADAFKWILLAGDVERYAPDNSKWMNE